MSSYASDTSVPVERSRAEIEFLLTKHGADEVGFSTNPLRAVMFFKFKGCNFKFTLPLPDTKDREVRPAWRIEEDA